MIQNFLLDQARIIRNNFFRLKNASLHSKLAERKTYQKKEFDRVAQDFSKNYNKLDSFGIDKFTTPLWKNSMNFTIAMRKEI